MRGARPRSAASLPPPFVILGLAFVLAATLFCSAELKVKSKADSTSWPQRYTFVDGDSDGMIDAVSWPDSTQRYTFVDENGDGMVEVTRREDGRVCVAFVEGGCP